jgi:hypothetical protein
MDKPSRESLDQMRSRGGNWAAYENKALDSASLGHLQFLKVGSGCTFNCPPRTYPFGIGWKYLYVGMVDLEAGTIIAGDSNEEARD